MSLVICGVLLLKRTGKLQRIVGIGSVYEPAGLVLLPLLVDKAKTSRVLNGFLLSHVLAASLKSGNSFRIGSAFGGLLLLCGHLRRVRNLHGGISLFSVADLLLLGEIVSLLAIYEIHSLQSLNMVSID